MNTRERLQTELDKLARAGNLREIPRAAFDGIYAVRDGRRMINLSSNDYLGIAADETLFAEFRETLPRAAFKPTAASSRLLTGNCDAADKLETLLADMYGTETALVFGSGYHANTGILPALANKESVILADKLVHASVIDGLKLTQSQYVRYRHNDLADLRRHIENTRGKNPRADIFIVTESVFSMDGDVADLRALVALKNEFGNIMLYVDEAHAVGARGATGLGIAEEQGCVADIDILVGTFGKALASVGAFVVCDRVVRETLVNKMRTLIFTTALPPLNLAWTAFVLRKIPYMQNARAQLARHGEILKQAVTGSAGILPAKNISQSHIVPWIIGDSRDSATRAQDLQSCGFYALPIRPPTVPEGTSRIRFSLNAAIPESDIEALAAHITHTHTKE